jgi:hypothetical protein
MKTKLVKSELDEFVGYNNIRYDKINDIDNNSCYELYIDSGILKLVPNKLFKDFIKTCCQKIRLNGILIITGVDIMNISLSYIHRYIDEEYLSNFLDNSIGFYNCRIVEEEIKKNGLKIHSMSISDNIFVVRGIRE